MGVPVDEHCTVILKQVSSMRGEEPRIPRMKLIFCCSVQFLYNWQLRGCVSRRPPLLMNMFSRPWRIIMMMGRPLCYRKRFPLVNSVNSL